MGASDQRQNRNEAMTSGPPPPPTLGFELDAVRVRDDSWTGRVVANGSIILEAEGNHSPSQAIANAQDDFIMVLRWMVDQFEEAMVAQAEQATKDEEPFS